MNVLKKKKKRGNLKIKLISFMNSVFRLEPHSDGNPQRVTAKDPGEEN